MARTGKDGSTDKKDDQEGCLYNELPKRTITWENDPKGPKRDSYDSGDLYKPAIYNPAMHVMRF